MQIGKDTQRRRNEKKSKKKRLRTYVLAVDAVLGELIVQGLGNQLVAPVGLHAGGDGGVEGGGGVADGEALEVQHGVAGGGGVGVLVHDLLGQGRHVVAAVRLRGNIQVVGAVLGEAGQESLDHGVVILGGLSVA
jgi:hypothetical protein